MYTEYVFDNKKYEVAAREIKASLFDIVTTEEEKIANLREKAFVEVNSQEVAAELQELYVQQDTFLRDLLEIGEKLNKALQKADSCSRKLKQIEQKHAAQIIATIQEPTATQEVVSQQENVADAAIQPVDAPKEEVKNEQNTTETKTEAVEATEQVENQVDKQATASEPATTAPQESQTEELATTAVQEVQTEEATTTAPQDAQTEEVTTPATDSSQETQNEEASNETNETQTVTTDAPKEEKIPQDPTVNSNEDAAISAGIVEDDGDALAGVYDPGSITATDVGAVSLGGLAPSSSYKDGSFLSHERNNQQSETSEEPVIMSVEDGAEQPVIVEEQPVITPIEDNQEQVIEGGSAPLIPPVIDDNSVITDNNAGGPLLTPIPESTDNSAVIQDASTVSEAPAITEQVPAENATLYANFKKRSQDPTKAIMISSSQAANLRKSFPTQEALFKGMFHPVQETASDANLEQQLMNNGLLDADTATKQAQIEQMMEQANALYSSGQVEAAQNMYNQISILNKELQGESAGLAI